MKQFEYYAPDVRRTDQLGAALSEVLPAGTTVAIWMTAATEPQGAASMGQTAVAPTRPATITIRGLTVFAHHGTSEEERSLGQNFCFHIDVTVLDCAGCRSDDVADTVDYASVVDVAVHVAKNFRFQLLEALAEAVCLEILEEFPIQEVRLTVEKPAPALPHPVDAVSISLTRTRRDLGADTPDA